jgi:hypothetical protein
MAHFFVARHKMSLVVLFIQLVPFCLGASNCIHFRKSYRYRYTKQSLFTNKRARNESKTKVGAHYTKDSGPTVVYLINPEAIR